VDQFLETGGTLSSRTEGIGRSIQDLDRQREAMDRRLADTEQRYRDQFTTLDTLLSNLRATSNYLTQQLAALSNN
jgi:flagellar hook-associated protein 2